jgi:hypothetical protein
MNTLLPQQHYLDLEKSKVEHLLSIIIGYLATLQGTKDPNNWNWKRMRILLALDSGCAATIINHSLI